MNCVVCKGSMKPLFLAHSFFCPNDCDRKPPPIRKPWEEARDRGCPRCKSGGWSFWMETQDRDPFTGMWFGTTYTFCCRGCGFNEVHTDTAPRISLPVPP